MFLQGFCKWRILRGYVCLMEYTPLEAQNNSLDNDPSECGELSWVVLQRGDGAISDEIAIEFSINAKAK